MGDVIEILTTSTNAVEVIAQGPQGPKGDKGDPGDVAGLPLSVQGDTLYRGASQNERLAIGTTGQVLKVSAQGLPTWANESGAVTSVNGQTGAVTVAAAQHAAEHEAGEADEIQAMAALVTTDASVEERLDGVYFHDGTTTSGRPNFFRTGTRKNTKLQWNNSTGVWELIKNNVARAQSEANASTRPWLGGTWEDPASPPVITTITVARLGLEDMVQKVAETGSAATATTSQDGLISASDQQKLNGISSGAEVNVQANWTEADTGSDAFILNKPSTFAPSAHSSGHAVGGSDPVSPASIGAQSLFTAVNVQSGSQTSPHQLSALRAQAVRVATTINFTIRLPETGHQSGDIVEIRAATLSSGATITIERGVGPSFWTTLATITSQGGKLRFVANGTGRSDWEEDTYFTTNGTIGAPAVHEHAASAITSGSFGNISHDGKIGSTAGLPVVTTTAGAVTTLALGTAGQILRTKSDLSGVEFADPAAAGVTSVTGTAPIVSSGGTTPAISVTVGTGANTVAAGDDSRITGAIQSTLVDAKGDLIVATAADTVARLPVGATNGHVLTVDSAEAGGMKWAAPSGGIGGSTGATDRAILRASGTAGATAQNSALNIEDASTTTQNNVAITNQHSGQTNSALVLTPKGTGQFILGPAPTGSSSTGNARGSRAIDLQLDRGLSTQVASGSSSFAAGSSNTASGIESVAIGSANTASGNYSFSANRANVASSSRSACLGGAGGEANRVSSVVFSSDNATTGNRQRIHAILHNTSSGTAASELWINPGDAFRFTIPSGKAVAMIINIIGTLSGGSSIAHYVRQYCLKNVSGTTSEVYAAATIGTDNAAGTTVTLSANDAADAIKIECAGALTGQSWNWVATIDAVERTF